MTVPELLAPFPRERTWLLPALLAVQRAERWLAPAALDAVAAHLRVPASEVWGVASHYPELRLAEPGRTLVRVCTGVSCRVTGGRELLAACERRLGVPAGRTTADGAVTLEELDCAFACSVAPVVEIGHAYHGRVQSADLDALLAGDGPANRPAPPAAPAERGAPVADLPSGASAAARFAALLERAQKRRSGATLAVGLGTCAVAVGADAVFDALRTGVASRGLPFTVVAAGCNGLCWAQPLVTVLREGQPPVVVGPLTAAGAPRLLDALTASAPLADVGADVLASQRRVLLERCGATDPGDIADALRRGAYAAFAHALAAGAPERVIEEVRAAGLAGRGGAYFPTAVKWAACRAARGAPKYVVVNGEEGEPGIFKDRHVMEGDPHLLLEATLLAAWAVGASRAILYIHGEAELSAARLARTVEQARAWGLLGESILGAAFSLDVEIRRGAGGFVLGEETALLESIEGRRAMPRTRPPFPVDSGLFGRPTVINAGDRRARRRVVRRARRRARHEALRPLGPRQAAGSRRDGARLHAPHPPRDARRRHALGPPAPGRRAGRAVGQRRPPAPARRAAGAARPREPGHRRRRGARRDGLGRRRGADAPGVQHAGVVRQVHALPRGDGPPARPARRPRGRRRDRVARRGDPGGVALRPRPGGAGQRALGARRVPRRVRAIIEGP
ncbi:MAG: NAD(P)H-dependent oxidoreductase subunit E [Candidatus Rokubacteria bacterium]|nr:NAD(P)H-dependent oxidoreductase subunit E [Candidatus Rokubacteria bacterium]